MNPHPPLEIEVKLRVEAFEALRRGLTALGFAEEQPLRPESSVLWDREGELQAAGCALRVRRYAGQAWVTFKGPRQAHPELKIRPEQETRVDDPEALEAILAALGYAPVLRLEKARSLWRGPGLLACLDETPVGRFLELEGDEARIRATMAGLGLGTETVEPCSYPTLYHRAGLGDPQA